MAAFFHGESETTEPSSDLFMTNLNPFPDSITINGRNNYFNNFCFEFQQTPQILSKDEIDHSKQGSSQVSNGGVTQNFKALAPTYLKPTQELLNEIVNAIGMNQESRIYGHNGVGGGYKSGVAADRQELHLKKAKLISMVEEVEQGYNQYHNQIMTVITSFEQAAGLGSANSYTHLVLQMISKQFRGVKDMINLEIKHINKLLGEKQCEGVNLANDQLKQLGKMTHPHSNAWRPQRGLPETAVSVLRAWLFQHFLHPYPRDVDKERLAKQTGLTKSQVSNWFINARVRVWKPMVEEMYLEEIGTEQNKKGGKLHEHSHKGSSSKRAYKNTTSDESSNVILPTFHQGFIENEVVPMQNSSSSCSVVTFKKQPMNQANFIHFNGGFENYNTTIVGNSVSLSLGLPDVCDQTFNSIQFGSTSNGSEISGIYPSSIYQIMD